MRNIYVDDQEYLAFNLSSPRGRHIQLNCFVDWDHAGNRKTRRT